MFRYTVTFLLIFMVLNHDLAAARQVEFVPESPNERLQKRNADDGNIEGIGIASTTCASTIELVVLVDK